LNDPFVLPSLEQIEQMERQRCQAIESLEIYDDSVKCQKCGIAVPMIGKSISISNKPKNNRIAVLERRINWLENYPRTSNYRPSSHTNNVVKQLKQELADLLQEDAKADKLRSLPLYSCRITDFRFVCSKCMIRSTCILLQSP
jgi:adenine-specific DNA methylase